MKEEIKEILKIFKKCEFGVCITKHDSRVLLDCITNLEKELQESNESITWWTNRFKAIEKENEKLKEYVLKNSYLDLAGNRCWVNKHSAKK